MANPAAPAGPTNGGPAARPNDDSPWNNIMGIAKVRMLLDHESMPVCLQRCIANVHGLGCDASWYVLR